MIIIIIEMYGVNIHFETLVQGIMEEQFNWMVIPG